MKKKRYLSVLYDEKKKPSTQYPYDFAQYLMNRFNIKSGSTLLDAGCGRGEMLSTFGKHGLKCFGCDLEAPSEWSDECEIKELDFKRSPFPYPDDSFDALFSKSVIEHMVEPTNYLSEIYRVLRPNGIFIILAPDWESQFRVFYEDPTHIHPYTPSGIENLLKLSGFQKVGVEEFSHHQLLWQNTSWRFVAKTLKLFISIQNARRLTKITGIKFFRWAVELQVLGFGYK